MTIRASQAGNSNYNAASNVDRIFTVLPAQISTARADFNGDSKSDIIWQNAITVDSYIWLMNGTAYCSHIYLTTLPTEWRLTN